ncbi:MAG: hypothetical protein ACK46Q_04855 [Hyphomonas sp.]
MNSVRGLMSLAVSLMVASCANAAPLPDIAVGQIWSIKDASTPSTQITIERIELYASDSVVHISVEGVPISTFIVDGVPHVRIGAIGHMPFEKSALLESLDQLQQTEAEGSAFFEQGYLQWKKDKGGIFSIPVSQAIELSLSITPQ